MGSIFDFIPGNGPMAMIRQMMGNASPEQFAQNLMRTNPKFKQFVDANKGKSLQQICSENRLSYDMVRRQLG